MKKTKRKYILFAAKVISIFYIALLTLFSFDSENFIGLIIHLIPTMIFTICLIIAWFRPKLGGVLFALAGIGTIIVFNTYREAIPFITISTIPILTGILFWFSKKK